MADILIRGMEMPTQCGNCPMSTNARRCTILWREFGDPSKRLEDCPLIPLLIDVDKLRHVIESVNLAWREYEQSVSDCFAELVNFHTIIEAEGGSDNG